MIRDQRAGSAWLFAALILSSLAGNAQDTKTTRATPKPENRSQPVEPGSKDVEVDAGLLEFLGGLDAEDNDWIDYLSHTEVTAVTKAPPSKTANADGATKKKDE